MVQQLRLLDANLPGFHTFHILPLAPFLLVL
jgi:hypothetical protein